MITGFEKAEITVLVDDLPHPDLESLYPAHGLSILVSLYRENKKYNVLFDTGPSLDLLLHNAEQLGKAPLLPSTIFISVWIDHHVGGLVDSIRRGEKPWSYVVAPEYPGKRRRPPAKGTLPPGVTTIGPWGRWFREQALAFHIKGEGWVVLVGCAVYGVRNLVKMLNKVERLYAIIGGLNLSALDVLDGPLFLKWAKKRGVELIIPLHSVTVRARRIILKRYGGGLSWSGVGLNVEL